MHRFFRKMLRPAASIFAAFSILASAAPVAAAFKNTVTTLRVGLCFESNNTAMTTLTLTNNIGKGFSFGTFDSSRNFVKNNITTAAGVSSINLNAKSGVVVVTNASNNEVLYQISTASAALGVMPIENGTGKPVTMTNWSFAYYGGFDITALASEKLQVINVVNLEDYVKGVIPAEMSATWPVEALKAQSMCARNYAVNNLGKHGDFDVCDAADCQVYDGTYFATPTTDSAVDATAGKFVLYNDKPCQTYFYSANGGASESSENVWVTALPYLVGRFDEYDTGGDSTHSSWTFTYTGAEIAGLLQNWGYTIDTVTSITPTYTAVGNIYSLTFSDGKTTVTVNKQDAGNILCSSKLAKYTYSQRFNVVGDSSTATGIFINNSSSPLDSILTTYATGGDGGVSKVAVDSGKVSVMTGSGIQTIDTYGSGREQTGSTFTVKGSGWGHNVGMSQYGAKAMAQAGFGYVDIIKYYFAGVTIA